MQIILLLLLTVPALSQAYNNIPSNIRIMPLSQMDFPDEMKKEMRENVTSNQLKGYSHVDSVYPRTLLRIGNQKQTYSVNANPGNTELKKKLSEIKLNFTYNSLSPDSIGFAPIGIHTKDGWAGVKEFFNGKELGICTLSIFNIAKVEEPIELNEEGLCFSVNGKPTRTSIEGSHNSGFIYSVRWYDNRFVRDLECANMRLDKEITNKMVVLANKIDKQ